MIITKKMDGREVGFQDDGCFSRFLKQEQITTTFLTFLNLTPTLTLNLTSP